MIAVVPGANAAASGEVAHAAIGKMATCDTLLLQMKIPLDTIETAASLARGKGIRTILNLAPATRDIGRVANLVDILVANESEFEILVGRPLSSNEALIELHEKTQQTIVVTLGAEGVVPVHNGRLELAPSLKIEPVDTVGAGDTFTGYLAVSIDGGVEFDEALKAAAAAASLACLASGAQPAIPTIEELREVLSRT